MDLSGFIVLALLVVLAVVALRASLTKVPRDANWTVERLGLFNRVLKPGLHFVLPLVERIGARIDMRQTTLDVPPQPVTTRDDAQVEAGAVLTYQVVDPVKAAYEVADLKLALVQLVGTSMRDAVGARPLVALARERPAVNADMLQGIEAAVDAWGVKALHLELKGIALPD